MAELRTHRLLLRRWRDEDDEPMARVNADPEVMRFIGEGTALTRAESDAALDGWRRHWEREGFGLFAVELLATGELVGFAGPARPYFAPELLPSIEIGWRLARDRWGKGYATEAAIASRDWAFRELLVDHLISVIHPSNEASRGVARRIGAVLDRVHTDPRHGWTDEIWMVRRPTAL